ncbi:MAG TPA: hypothetical protein VLH79_03745 [Chthonomonadales bacterium]|nr:hypothetical protein [Chthonomonadales bacterium]
MSISDAKKLVGRLCSVSWLDRKGMEQQVVSRVHSVTFVALYGGYMVTDTEDVRLDRILRVCAVSSDGGLEPVYSLEAAAAAQAA